MVRDKIIPKGYKKTVIGVIPEDWGVKKYGEILEYEQPTKYLVNTKILETGNTPVLTAGKSIILGYTNETTGVYENTPVIIFDDFTTSSKYIDYDFKVKSSAMKFLKIDNSQNSLRYYSALMQIQDFNVASHKRHWISEYSNLLAPYPKPKEQTAIANVFFKVDGLIENLANLIQKKRRIKKGVMQELLTGKGRLPGFDGEWEERKLGEIGDISGSGVNKKIIPGEKPVRLVNFMDVYKRNFIYSKDLYHEVTSPFNKAAKCAVNKGDVFFTPTSETQDDIGFSAVAMEDISDGVYSYHVVRLRLREPWNLLYRAYAFKTADFYNQAGKYSQGSGTRYVITQADFAEINVKYPSDAEEQKAIASTIFQMDQEINHLQKLKHKYQLIKQGMMQQLLTGKIRLI